MNELQEKLDWLESKGYFKFEDMYICEIKGGHKIHEQAVNDAPLGMLKASYEKWIEAVFNQHKVMGLKKEVIVKLRDRETYKLQYGAYVYIHAEVTVKQNGIETYTMRGEFKFEGHPKGDMKYYEEVIRGSFL